MTRTRKCDSPAPDDAEETCKNSGDEKQSKGCNAGDIIYSVTI